MRVRLRSERGFGLIELLMAMVMLNIGILAIVAAFNSGTVALNRASGDADALKWAELHADIIRRFGRFPHRNAVLGRATTPEEQAFLDGGGFAG